MSEILSRIADRHPLSSEHAEDGRYTWPERWNEAHDEIADLEAKLEASGKLIALYEEEFNSVAPMLMIHGWRAPDKNVRLGEELRAQIAAAQQEQEDE